MRARRPSGTTVIVAATIGLLAWIGWAVGTVMSDQRDVIDQLEAAAEHRETVAEQREESAEAMLAETRRLVEEMRDPVEHAPESPRAETYEAVPEAVESLREMQRFLAEICDADPDCDIETCCDGAPQGGADGDAD